MDAGYLEIAGVVLTIILAVLAGVFIVSAAAISVANLFGLGPLARDGRNAPRRRWLVRLPEGDHQLEVTDGIDHPLHIWDDGVPIGLDWSVGRAWFDLAGHDAEVVPADNVADVITEGVVSGAIAAVLGGSAAPGRPSPHVDLIVDGARVEPVRRRTGRRG